MMFKPSNQSRSGRGRRRAAAVLTTLAAAVALSTAPASAATSAASMTTGFSSVSSWGDCPAEWFCAWENADASGHWARFKTGAEDLQTPINGYVFNDKFQYAYNRSGAKFILYEHAHYKGRTLPIANTWRGPLAVKYTFAKITSSLTITG